MSDIKRGFEGLWKEMIRYDTTDNQTLSYQPRFVNNELNSRDSIPTLGVKNGTPAADKIKFLNATGAPINPTPGSIGTCTYMIIPGGQFTSDNKQVLIQSLDEISRDQKIIFEIGTSERGGSTHELLAKKSDSDHLISLDLRPTMKEKGGIPKGPPEFKEGTFHQLRMRSSNSEKVKDKIQEITGDRNRKIDLIFIDGDHSVETVFMEWSLYEPMLADDGVLLLHDTTFHPGPYLLVEAINKKMFSVEVFCEGQDYGIAKIKRL